jgi:hypothetical protein
MHSQHDAHETTAAPRAAFLARFEPQRRLTGHSPKRTIWIYRKVPAVSGCVISPAGDHQTKLHA